VVVGKAVVCHDSDENLCWGVSVVGYSVIDSLKEGKTDQDYHLMLLYHGLATYPPLLNFMDVMALAYAFLPPFFGIRTDGVLLG
jgi:hypothetical protein